jgi:histidyl-tRNA synthetase
MDESLGGTYQAIASGFRAAGVPCEVLTEPKKPVQQFTLAEKKGAAWVVVAGKDELARGVLTLRKLATRENIEGLTLDQAIALVRTEA